MVDSGPNDPTYDKCHAIYLIRKDGEDGKPCRHIDEWVLEEYGCTCEVYQDPDSTVDMSDATSKRGGVGGGDDWDDADIVMKTGTNSEAEQDIEHPYETTVEWNGDGDFDI